MAPSSNVHISIRCDINNFQQYVGYYIDRVSVLSPIAVDILMDTMARDRGLDIILNKVFLVYIIKRTPAQLTKMRLCAFHESTFIEEQMYAVPICEHGCAT